MLCLWCSLTPCHYATERASLIHAKGVSHSPHTWFTSPGRGQLVDVGAERVQVCCACSAPSPHAIARRFPQLASYPHPTPTSLTWLRSAC